MLENVDVIKGLIAIKGLQATAFLRNLRISVRRKRKIKQLILRAPHVAIGAQKLQYI